MDYRIVKFRAVIGIAWGLGVVCRAGIGCGAAEPADLPPMSKVQEIVLRHFALLPDYRPGDILARTEVEPLFPQLARIGWAVADRKDILGKVPADSDYVVRELHTPQGRKFMRRIADHAGAYDRLHRLSWLPHGRRTVHDLIHKKGGEEMIEYLTTSSGGNELGKMLSKAPKGADFNKPTGRIYTAEMLLAALKRSYAAAEEAGTRKKPAEN